MTLPSGPTTGDPGYEVRDTNVRAVIIFLIGLILFLVVVQFALWAMLRGLAASSSTIPRPTTEPIKPRSAPEMLGEQLRALRLREDAELGIGSSAPPPSGRLTIEQAIDAIAEKGLPATAAGLTEADVVGHSGQPVDAKDTKAKDSPGPGGDQ
ncbi:MAG: hypothetical protein AB7I30_18665 [Isosphaeraceae bacterium]